MDLPDWASIILLLFFLLMSAFYSATETAFACLNKYKFQIEAEDGKTYKYQYLVLTLPGYGVRVMRHSDSPNWDGAIKMAVEYLPYSETLPDFSGFKSIPSVMFVY